MIQEHMKSMSPKTHQRMQAMHEIWLVLAFTASWVVALWLYSRGR